MLIFNSENKITTIENISTPLPVDHYWVLDLNLKDFTLSPLAILEETKCPSIELLIDGFVCILPATWNMLICDQENYQLDVIEIAEIPGREFTAFSYGLNCSRVIPKLVTAINYFPNYTNIGPFINKNLMMCHPISDSMWINIAPTDVYNKTLKNLIAGDLI